MKLFKEVISIKLKLNGYSKCLTTNELNKIDTFCIKNKNKIKYEINNETNTIIIKDKEVLINRESIEFQNILRFIENKHTISNYIIKDNNINLEINIYTKRIISNEKELIINYLVEDSNYEYEYKVELGG